MRASWRYAGLLIAASSTLLPGRSKHRFTSARAGSECSRKSLQFPDSPGKANSELKQRKLFFFSVFRCMGRSICCIDIVASSSALPSEKIVDHLDAGSEVLVFRLRVEVNEVGECVLVGVDEAGEWAAIRHGEKLFWTPMVGDQGEDLLAKVLPLNGPTGSQSKRVSQYQRAWDALEFCMNLKQFGPDTATLFIPNLPLDLVQQLELAGCETRSALVRINRESLRSFRTLHDLQQKMVTASKQEGAEVGPRASTSKYRTWRTGAGKAQGQSRKEYREIGLRLELLVKALGAGPSTAEVARVVGVISKKKSSPHAFVAIVGQQMLGQTYWTRMWILWFICRRETPEL